MPMPQPHRDEGHDDFMDRCMAEMHKEFSDPAQRQAVCERQWRDDRGGGSRAMKYAHVVRWFTSVAWAILPTKLQAMMDALAFLAAGGEYAADEVAMIAGRPREATRVKGAVAVLPLVGVISQRANLVVEASGGTSLEQFSAGFRAAMADPGIGAIVLDVDSPGGAVTGVDELSTEIHATRGQKPVLAVANGMAASAAYWIATAADELIVTPSGEVGSIGVFAAHQDMSGAYERAGVKTTLVSAGKYKTEGNEFEALADDGRAALQVRVDEYYEMFVAAVARNRNVPVADVRNGFGEGRVVGARRARQLGMVDRVATLDETIDRLAGRGSRRTPMATMAARVRLAEHTLR